MADEETKVEYQFTGDVSSLAKATRKAIDLLDSYEGAVKKAASTDVLQANKTSFTGFSRTLNNITKQVNDLVTSINKSPNGVAKGIAADLPKVQSVVREIGDALDILKSSTKITSKDIQFLTEYLKDTQSTITQVSDKARILSTAFKGVKTLNVDTNVEPAVQSAENVAKAYERADASVATSTDHMSNAINRLAQQGKAVQFAREVESSYDRVTKSARESAAAMFSQGDVGFEDKLERIRTKSNEVFGKIRNTFAQFSKIFQPLKTGADQAAQTFTSLKDKAANAMNRIVQVVLAAGSGLRQFKGEADSAADYMSSFGQKAAKAVSAISPKVKAAVTAFEALSKIVKNIAKVFKTAKSGIDAVRNALSKLSPQADKASSSLRSMTSLLSGAVLGHALVEATKSSMAFIENLNLFTVAMGDSIDEAQKFIDRMAEIYGMDPSNLYRYAGYFNQLTEAIGMTSEASKTISLSLTKASNDIASLFNVNIEQVVNNLASGMSGMSMAVRKYGIDIRKTTLQQTGLTYGFRENISTTSEANRQALRYLTIMQQVRNATKQVTTSTNGANQIIGDFARNIETPANQLRILKEQAGQVARAFGNFFIPIMQKVLYVINGVMMALKTLLTFFASLAGIDIGSFGGEVSKGADEAAESVGGIGDAAKDSAKKLKSLTAPFDELNVFTTPEPTGGVGGGGGFGGDLLDPALLEAIEQMSLELDEVRMKALDVRDTILRVLGLRIDESDIVVIPDGFIDNLIKLWDNADYTGFGKRIAQFLNMGIEWGILNTDPEVYAPILNQKVATLAQILNGFVAGFNWEGLGTIIGNGITLALGMANTFLTTFDFKQFGVSIGNLLNGVMAAVNWDLLGETMGNLVMAQVRKLSGFFATFKWAELGSNLGKAFMRMLNTINWEELGQLAALKWNSIIDAIRAFWATYEWGTLGSKLALYFSTAVREINWHNLGAAFSATLRGLLRDVTNFLGELDWFSIGKAITEFILAIDWLGLLTDLVVAVITILGAVVRSLLGMIVGIFTGVGLDVTEGFKGGILQGLANIADWLWEHLVDPVIRAVKGFFGIHSPSTVFEDIGGNLIRGLFNGITNMITGVGDWIKTHLCDPVIDGVKNFFGITGDSSTIFLNIGTQLLNGMFEGLGNIGKKVTAWGNNLLKKVEDVFGIASPSKEFKKIGDFMVAGMMRGLSNLNEMEIRYKIMLNGMIEATDGFTGNVVDRCHALADTVNSITNIVEGNQREFTKDISNMYANMANASILSINSIKSALDEIPRNITTVHKIVTEQVAQAGGGGFSGGSGGGSSSLKSAISSAYSGAKMAAGGVVTGPTRALIGEGRYDEAVIPLGNSPQIEELIEKIGRRIDGNSGSTPQPVEVHVFIGGREWDAFTYESSQRGKDIVGASPIKEN